jgi:hypothetical protein
MMGSTKFQASNNKQVPMNEIPISKRIRLGRLEFGIYLGFGF